MKITTFLLLTIFGISSFISLNAQTPIAFQISEGVRPNSLFSLYGDGLTRQAKYKLEETGDILTPVQLDAAGRFIRFIMPSSQIGAYTIVVSEDGGVNWKAANPNRPVYINRPDVRWTSDVRVYEGLKARLIGRNLDAAEFNGKSNTEVRFVPEGGGSNLAAVIDSLTPYCIKYTVPSGLTVGNNYYIEVKNNCAGRGADWVRMRDYPEYTDTKVKVEARPASQLALDLGVGWAVDFNWSNVKNVKSDYGAKGDGVTDDSPAIQSAIDAVNAAGGGVIYFPSGEYFIKRIFLDKGVVLNGESNTNTILKLTTTVGCVINNKKKAISDGLIGVANFKIINTPGSIPGSIINWGSATAADMFLFNNYIDLTLNRTNYFNGSGSPSSWTANSNCLLKNNYIIDRNPGSPNVRNNYQVIGNYIEYCDWTMEVFGTNGYVYCNNTDKGIRNSATVEGPKGQYYSIYSGNKAVNTRGSYFGFNTTIQMTSNNFDSGDAAEAFTDMGFGIQKLQGMATASTSSSVDVNAKDISGEPWTLPFMVRVLRGKGVGQLRFFSGYSDLGGGNYRLNVTIPWDVLPDNTSEICVARYSLNMVQEGQKVNNANMATWLYNGAYDNIISDYTSINGGGFTVSGQSRRKVDYEHLDCNAAFVAIKRSTSIGPSLDKNQEPNNTAIIAYDTYNGNPYSGGQHGYPGYGPIVYGLEVRDCMIDRTGCRNDRPASYGYFYNAGITFGPGDTSPGKGEGILGSLIENLTIKNSPLGIKMYSGPTTSTTAIRAMKYINVETPIDSSGGFFIKFIDGEPDVSNWDKNSSPTVLGYDKIGENVDGSSSNALNAIQYRAKTSFQAGIMKIYLKMPVNGKMKLAIYSDRNSAPDSLLTESEEITNPGSGWIKFHSNKEMPVIKDSVYWLSVWSNASYEVNYEDKGASHRTKNLTYGAWPDSYGAIGTVDTKMFSIYAEAKTKASVIITNIQQEVDGMPKPVQIETQPAGLMIDVTYDGSPVPPTAAGEYTVIATINDPDYKGTSTATLNLVGYESSLILDNCDSNMGWNETTLDITNKQEGAACLTTTIAGADEFAKKFDIPHNPSGISESNGYLMFFFYVGDVSKLTGDNQVEIGSAGTMDIDEFSWSLPASQLKNGWNHVALKLSDAYRTGSPNMKAINWFRIYHVKSESITVKIDEIRFFAPISFNNQGFEMGNLSEWANGNYGTGSAPKITTDISKVYSGTYAAIVNGTSSGIWRKIPDIKDNTSYTITAWSKLGDSNQKGYIYVKNYDETNTAVRDNVTSTLYQMYSLSFTTGNNAGNTEFGAWRENDAGNGDIYYDDFQISQTISAKITISDTLQKFDGTAKFAKIATIPDGLKIDVTYNGKVEVPINIGSYSVIATINDPLYKGTAKANLVIGEVTEVDKSSTLAHFNVYPNPVSDILTISPGFEFSNLTIKIFNVTGAIVYEELHANNPVRIDISGFPKGIYNLKAFTDIKIYTEKIIIK
jgi:hypothetical protein